jgi:hypothetical protein
VTIEEKARAYLLKRFPEYQKDDSVMHVDVEVYKSGYLQALDDVLLAVAREQMYREYRSEIDQDGSAIGACKEIAGYVRALKEGAK